MECQADAVIGYAILREIVGAYFFGAVAGFDLATAYAGERGLPLLLLLFVEARAENAHSFRAILDLGFFVLLRDDQSAGDMRDADGGIGGVNGLAAGAVREERISAQIFCFNLDVDVLCVGDTRGG